MIFVSPLTSLIIRGSQFVCTIIVLGTTGQLVNSYSGFVIDKFNIGLATSVLSLCYFIWLGAGYYWPRFINTGVVLIAESLLTILWLASFACLADVWGSASCSNTYYYAGFSYGYGNSSDCHVGKAALAFAVIAWLLFMVSLGLLIYFTIIPISKHSRFASCFTVNHSFIPGVIFYNLSLSPSDGINPLLESEPKIGEPQSEPEPYSQPSATNKQTMSNSDAPHLHDGPDSDSLNHSEPGKSDFSQHNHVDPERVVANKV
jgi:hypothetical protein